MMHYRSNRITLTFLDSVSNQATSQNGRLTGRIQGFVFVAPILRIVK